MVRLIETAIFRKLSHWWASLRGNGVVSKCVYVEPPLRDELFSSAQMEQHGKTLAGSHTLSLSPGHAPDRLLSRLADNEGVLISVQNLLTEAIKANRRVTPAGEWL